MASSTFALLGGPKADTRDPGGLFTWPIITREDEVAMLDVLHHRAMSSSDVPVAFAREFAAWQGAGVPGHVSSGVLARRHRGVRGKVGTFGDVAARSLMTGKSLAVGKVGILSRTNAADTSAPFR